MWDGADYTLSELVDLAVNCIDPDSDDWRMSGTENTQRFERLMPILMEEVEIDPGQYQISDSTFRSALKTFLNDIKNKENPGDYFVDNIGELRERIGTRDKKQYTIGFPLNIKFRPGRKRDQFESLGHKIDRMNRGRWLSEFKEVAEEKEKEKSRECEDDPLTEFMEQVPNDFSFNTYTFWKFEIEARDEQFVIDRLERVLGYLLGRINASAYADKLEGWGFSRSIWPSGWSDLRHPFIYIVFEEGEYSKFYYDEDISPRKRFKVQSSRTRKFDILFNKFPDLDYPLNDVEERFVETLRRFQSAISGSDQQDSFLDYWRGIEALTLTDENERMDAVIRRAEAPIGARDQKFFRYRLKGAQKKRNRLVHEGVDVDVNRQDQNLLKTVLENLIWIYCANLKNWTKEEFRFFLENAGKTEGDLIEAYEDLEDKINIVDGLLEEIRYEESVFEKIYRDWTSGRNELEDAGFKDPFGFFYPVFGVGDEDAELMILADSPTYRVEEDEELRYRGQVRGWRPASSAWESMDEYREWLRQLLELTNPDGAWDVVEAVAEAVDADPEELYYTTLQKDGEFDESLDETEDGEDPAALNEESFSKWKPYLEGEIDHVEPRLIIAFGEKTLQALGDLFDPHEDFKTDLVPFGEPYVMDKYPVLRFDYWSEIETPEDVDKEELISDIVTEVWDSV